MSAICQDRIQVFRQDGTFVKEFWVEPQTLANGSVSLAGAEHLVAATVAMNGDRTHRDLPC